MAPNNSAGKLDERDSSTLMFRQDVQRDQRSLERTHSDWNGSAVPGRLVEVKQVQCVFLRLLKCRASTRRASALVLDYKDQVVGQENAVDALSNNRQHVLKKD